MQNIKIEIKQGQYQTATDNQFTVISITKINEFQKQILIKEPFTLKELSLIFLKLIRSFEK